jgi:hypothetical protein
MALPLTGTITSANILIELGFSNSSDVLRNVVQKPGGVLQVLVNSTWVNLNMCSIYLPTDVGPHIVPTHWRGYNHSTTGVETITISGDNTIDVGQTATYTASLTGENLTGIILTWSKFAGGAWVDNIATGTSVSIMWSDPRNAKVRVTASNVCNKNIFQKELNISYNCTPAISGSPYIGGTLEVNKSYNVWAVNGNGIVGEPGNTRLGISFFWEVFGSVQLISGQGTSKAVIRPTATSTNNIIIVTITSCGVSIKSSNIAFDAASPVTVYYNTVQSRNIQKICDGGQVGSFVTVTRAAGTHSSTSSVADANSQASAWLYTQDAQDVAQANGNCGNTVTYPNERQSQFFTKYCVSGFGTSVEYVVPAGTYYADSVGSANILALNYITSNGQNYANNNGQCNVNPCTRIVNSVSVTYAIGVGVINNIVVTGGVAETGFYSVKVKFNNVENNTSAFFSASGSVPNLSVSGTGQLEVTISSECSSQTWTSGTITVSGVPACITATSIDITPIRSAFLSGTAQFAVNVTPTGIGELSGYFTFLGVNYQISNADFTGGFTQYLSFTTNTTGTGVVTITLSGGNMCNSSISATTSTGVYIVAPS